MWSSNRKKAKFLTGQNYSSAHALKRQGSVTRPTNNIVRSYVQDVVYVYVHQAFFFTLCRPFASLALVATEIAGLPHVFPTHALTEPCEESDDTSSARI